ncbi:hypothetical protein Sjap_013232 [Stephania japonica]|uniref:Cytochrome P450 n=1 Tax=Stephania japonica TaxID=461633 RepID=A0AAP0IYQ6_9MAGN
MVRLFCVSNRVFNGNGANTTLGGHFSLSLFYLLLRRRSKQTNLPPSPPKLPLIGNFHQLSKRIHHSLKDLSQKYGPIMLLHFGQVPVVVVSSSSLAEEIFKTHDAVLSSRSPMTTAKILMYGCVDIGFAPYNESRQLRKICVMELLSVRTVKTFKTVREEEKIARKLDSFLEQVIEEHIIQSSSNDLDKAKDFVDVLLQIQEDEDNKISMKLTRDKIKALILDMFVGGTETSSKVIEWAMSELIRNPKIMKKAQEDVRRVVREKGKLKLDEEDIQEMDYLKCVIKEALRLHPPAPILERESSQSVNIKGYLLPPKTRVIINAWTIQWDPDTWSFAKEFIPERFIGSKFDFKGLDFEYFPFGKCLVAPMKRD